MTDDTFVCTECKCVVDGDTCPHCGADTVLVSDENGGGA